MALAVLTDIEDASSDLTTAVLVDLTVFGGVNPARNTLAAYLYLYKRDSSQTDTPVTVDNSSPLTTVS